MNENILDEEQLEQSNLRRRDLLPTWIKVFTWIFLIFGAIAPIALIMGIAGMYFSLSLYGLSTMEPLSLIGILIIFLFGLKGVVAFGLWTEKDWAIDLAIIDAIIGIIVCVVAMFVLPFVSSGLTISLRLELIPLVLYLNHMRKIKSDWSARRVF